MNSVFRPLLLDSYLAVIENSIGTNMFRTHYATVDNQKMDVLHDGELSCAFYVSSTLLVFGLVKESHMTVASTVKDLTESGWVVVTSPKQGDVIVWSTREGDVIVPQHIGFSVNDKTVVSNSTKMRSPQKHSLHDIVGEITAYRHRALIAT